VAAHRSRPGSVVVDDVLRHQVEQALGQVRVPRGLPPIEEVGDELVIHPVGGALGLRLGHGFLLV
jgi:hypothetical protein